MAVLCKRENELRALNPVGERPLTTQMQSSTREGLAADNRVTVGGSCQMGANIRIFKSRQISKRCRTGDLAERADPTRMHQSLCFVVSRKSLNRNKEKINARVGGTDLRKIENRNHRRILLLSNGQAPAAEDRRSLGLVPRQGSESQSSCDRLGCGTYPHVLAAER
jgi:hypothetical protein